MQNVLVVDDEPDIREIIRLQLQGVGYGVLTAASAAEAISIVRKRGHRIDVALTDLNMPNMHGAQLAEALIAIQPHIKIGLMSGEFDVKPPSCESCSRCSHSLSKPFDSRALLSFVHQLGSTPNCDKLINQRRRDHGPRDSGLNRRGQTNQNFS